MYVQFVNYTVQIDADSSPILLATLSNVYQAVSTAFAFMKSDRMQFSD